MNTPEPLQVQQADSIWPAQVLESVDKWRILLVDVEAPKLRRLIRLLKRAGYEIATATNGREALAQLESSDFQIIITDWDMPEMDGIALCSTIRASQVRRYIYIVILTERDGIEHVVTGLQAGADDYLTRPVREQELIARLSTAKRIVGLESSLRRANIETARLAYLHPLTEVHNRRYMTERLARDVEQARRVGLSFSMLVCDIDEFKKVNDRFGHLAGSRVLVSVAGFLDSKATAIGGWLAHHGGDEFAIILPHTGLGSANEFAEGVRRALEAQVLLPDDQGLRITASFGLSGWERDQHCDVTVDELWRIADRCVYQSKSAGRNRVSVGILASDDTASSADA